MRARAIEVGKVSAVSCARADASVGGRGWMTARRVGRSGAGERDARLRWTPICDQVVISATCRSDGPSVPGERSPKRRARSGQAHLLQGAVPSRQPNEALAQVGHWARAGRRASARGPRPTRGASHEGGCRPTELFALAHALHDGLLFVWSAWTAVGGFLREELRRRGRGVSVQPGASRGRGSKGSSGALAGTRGRECVGDESEGDAPRRE